MWYRFVVILTALTPFFLFSEGQSNCMETKSEEQKTAQVVVLETNMGNIELQLFPEVAPKACENFMTLVGEKFYDGIVFHRVIKGFMIQGGDPLGTGFGGKSIWGKPFADECVSSLQFTKKGLLAMANSGPNTNQSQFFITTNPATWLNGKHTIFGEVLSGYNVVDNIEGAKTGAQDRPTEEIKITKAYCKAAKSE